ncbi:unnamed protein product, partial [Tetraodon nigroviridis]
ILHPGRGCHSSATCETSVAGPSSDNWRTPAATWSTSNRSSTTTATRVLATSDSTKHNHTHTHAHTHTYTHTQGFLPFLTFSSLPIQRRHLENGPPPYRNPPFLPPRQGFLKTDPPSRSPALEQDRRNP